ARRWCSTSARGEGASRLSSAGWGARPKKGLALAPRFLALPPRFLALPPSRTRFSLRWPSPKSGGNARGRFETKRLQSSTFSALGSVALAPVTRRNPVGEGASARGEGPHSRPRHGLRPTGAPMRHNGPFQRADGGSPYCPGPARRLHTRCFARDAIGEVAVMINAKTIAARSRPPGGGVLRLVVATALWAVVAAPAAAASSWG